ncbi:MAG: periplasmic heavy metal sensor [Candidatus Cloacimonetes bacterium]|nr:periplasmic heavy metal sensor [Candidatus Cloacimonadota bacterium]
MSKRLLTILLLVSLFLNAGIIGGLIVMGWYRQNHIVHHYQPEGPSSRDRDRIEIPELRDPQVIALRDSFLVIKKELLQELAKDPVNEAKITAIIERSIGAQSEMERALADKLLEYRKSLGPAEAKEHFNGRLDRMERYEERRNNRRETK